MCRLNNYIIFLRVRSTNLSLCLVSQAHSSQLNWLLLLVCPTARPPSQREFLQSATLPLVCINQGATLSLVSIFFSLSRHSFLLQGMHVEIQSGAKCKRTNTEMQEHHCAYGVTTRRLHSLIIQEILRHVNMPFSNGSQAALARSCAADSEEKPRLSVEKTSKMSCVTDAFM